jgi:hypothetical protein
MWGSVRGCWSCADRCAMLDDEERLLLDAPAKKTTRRRESKLCPTCWNDMRWTAEGYVCPRHGLVEARPERVLHPRTTSAGVSRPASVKREKRTRAKVQTAPRQTSQTDRLVARREEIIARNHAGESISAIAAALWQELGYASAHVCASKISHFLSRRGLHAAERRPGPPPGATAAQRFTPERLSELREALVAGSSVWAFAGAHWQEWGFSSRASCDSLLRKWMRTKATAA